MDVSFAKNLVQVYLNDKDSKGKIDKYEAMDLKAFAQDTGLSIGAKEYIKDQIKTGKVEKGAVPYIKDILAMPTTSEKISEPVKKEPERILDRTPVTTLNYYNSGYSSGYGYTKPQPEHPDGPIMKSIGNFFGRIK